MARRRSIHRCSNCGESSAGWVGRCPSCFEWNTMQEHALQEVALHPAGLLASSMAASGAGPATAGWNVATEDVPLGAFSGRAPDAHRPGRVPRILSNHERPVPAPLVPTDDVAPIPTGVAEFDRVLSGGLRPGSCTLVGGAPGVGKSTLLLQAATAAAAAGTAVLYVTAEESPAQVSLRAGRLGALPDNLNVCSVTDVAAIETAVFQCGAGMIIVDSIQTVSDPECRSAAGSVAQVRSSAARLAELAHLTNAALVLIGHVTKEGSLAGPRALEHLVDSVVSIEGDKSDGLRLVRAAKHRFGATGELGVLEMGPKGLVGVVDPAGLFLRDRRIDASGSVVFPAIEGSRPVLLEVQALVERTNNPMPRRSAQGIEQSRLALVMAVLAKRAGVRLEGYDVFASVVGGVKVREPGLDLAVALALTSALTDRVIASRTVVMGEIGLSGEIRQVGHVGRRVAEAARLGFDRALVPTGSAPTGEVGLAALPVASIEQAIAVAGLAASPARHT